ncbi:DUF4304 domain-containing protein [Thiocapsa marina]
MASPEKKHLEGILKPVLKNHGFRKSGATWHRDVGNCIQARRVR